MLLQEELRKIPFVRLVIPLIIGIYFASVFPTMKPGFFTLIILLAIAFILFIILANLWKNYHTIWISGLIINGLLSILGFLLFQQQHLRNNYLTKFDNNTIYSGYILEKSITNDTTNITLLCKIRAKRYNDNWYQTQGKVLLYINPDSLSKTLEAGDQMLFTSHLMPVKNPGNPNEFDYKSYLLRNNIYSTAFLNKGNWMVIGKRIKNLIIVTQRLNEHFLTLYSKYGISQNEYDIIAALVLGERSGMSQKIKNMYAHSGVIHILAVSGLHVGILFLVFNFLLTFLLKYKNGKWIRTIILIFIIWFYALLTGLPSSVVRASIMFTLIIIGKGANREVNILNVLAMSVFITLTANPLKLFDVGFQLSYTAVVGIVFFQPRIFNLFSIKSKMIKVIWQLLSVSLAAQIVTSPLTLYYFHYFPTYFWISNILVIPLVPVVFCMALLLLLFSFNDVIADVLSNVLSSSVKILNAFVDFISHLPHSSLNDVYISMEEVFLLYCFIIFLTLFLSLKSKKYLITTMLIVNIFVIYGIFIKMNIYKRRQFYVYNVPGYSSYSLITGEDATLFTNADTERDLDNLEFKIGNTLLSMRLSNIDSVFFGKFIDVIDSDFKEKGIYLINGNYLIMGNDSKTLIMRDEKILNAKSKSKLSLNNIVLNNNCSVGMEEILNLFIVKNVILDSSVLTWKAKNWKKECDMFNISCEYARQGCLCLTL